MVVTVVRVNAGTRNKGQRIRLGRQRGKEYSTLPLRRFNSTCLTRSGVIASGWVALCGEVRGGVIALVLVSGSVIPYTHQCLDETLQSCTVVPYT
jgi:hypothetical protein